MHVEYVFLNCVHGSSATHLFNYNVYSSQALVSTNVLNLPIPRQSLDAKRPVFRSERETKAYMI